MASFSTCATRRPVSASRVADLDAALEALDHSLRPLDVVLLMTGRDQFLGTPEYFEQPGMTRESTLWLCDQGVKVIGIDAYGFDRKFADMAEDARQTGRTAVAELYESRAEEYARYAATLRDAAILSLRMGRARREQDI